ncbi:TolC family protein [Edaphobacter sp. 12200R-103]|uniref:TolC family protein n=1 Tax=Edaphobacter sp. 12200R-103 TaxID=2703788 RepID=UPI00138D2AA5|nr:TolC family protein [Edaphobacter sp. 12200R-103]QHS53123.1 TolC family protein [Edaphobacter sp. 12200R-103]
MASVRTRLSCGLLWAASLAALGAVNQPQPAQLSLEQAEAVAVANQPRLLAEQLRARASEQRVHQARAGLKPVVEFNATGALVADPGTATSAGALPTSAVSNRFAYGGSLSQLVTDFGRTSALIRSARYASNAQVEAATLTKARVRLNVQEAYLGILGAEAVLRAARAALANRELISRQLDALTQNELRSTLDLNFAKVLESEAELAVVRAQSTVEQERSRLATAMGEQAPIRSRLIQPSFPSEFPATPEEVLAQAQTQRADLRAAEAQQKAAEAYAAAEKRLSYPSLNILGAAGQIPYHDHTLRDDYAAVGFNLNIPIFNGGLFAARRAEAQLEADARDQDSAALRIEVNQQVRDTWYRADEAFRSLSVTARLVAQSKEALRLAQDRYDAGLGSIVELNEAQLNETSAEISAADATYTYLSRLAELHFVTGLLN